MVDYLWSRECGLKETQRTLDRPPNDRWRELQSFMRCAMNDSVQYEAAVRMAKMAVQRLPSFAPARPATGQRSFTVIQRAT